ncbi:MAG: YCF48-related protein [Bacteroidota bacterium]|nr:YCF48-related protein [Bacteroidota bacterium]
MTTSNMFLGRKYHASTPSIWRSINSNGAIWDPCDNFRDELGNYYQTDIYDVAPYPVPGVGRNDELWICGSHPTGQQALPKSTTSPANERGIWYSTNAGLNWQAKTMGGHNLRSLVVIHKADNPHLITVTDNGEIFRSTNYGVDWSPVYSTNSVPMMMRVNRNTTPNTVILTTNNGIYRSTDEGANWSTVNSGLGTDLNVQSISIQTNSNTIFAGTANSLYKSTDNGDSWTEVGKQDGKLPHTLSR